MPHSTSTKNKRRRTNPSVPVAQPEFINQIKTSDDDQDSVEYWKRKYFQMLRTCGELRSILKVRDFQIDKYREMLGLPPQVKVGYVSPNAANSNLEQSWHWREMKQENVSDDDDDVSMNANPDSEVNSVTDDDDDDDVVNKSDLVDGGKGEANCSKTVEKIEAFAEIGNDVVKSSRARKSGRIRKPSVKKGKAMTMTRRVQGLSKGIKRKGRSAKTNNKNKLKSIRKTNSSSSSPSVAAATKAATSSPPELKFTCKICSKEFSTEMSLEKHGKFHLPDRQFECPECHQRFKHKVHMKVHLRTHTGAKPYNCKHCKKEFTQMANMVYHVRNHHPGKTS